MRLSPPTKIIFVLLRVSLGIVFIWASWEKILQPAGFASVIDNYRLLPQSILGGVAVVLPWIELLCGIALILGKYVKGSLLVVNLLLIVFAAALITNAVRGIDVDCGCFSVTAQANGSVYLDIFRDLVLLVIGLWLFFNQYQITARRRSAG